MPAEDDRAVMKRLAALEAEVSAEAEAQRARKEAALTQVREQRARAAAEREELRAQQAALVRRRPPAEEAEAEGAESGDDLGGALALARKAHGVHRELARAPRAGEKSWIKSGLASTVLGPLGWLYAGSLREAVPASAAWLAFGLIASKIIPLFLLMPVLMVVLPLSGIAGAMYAVHYNRSGKRQRLFGKDPGSKPKRQLPGK